MTPLRSRTVVFHVGAHKTGTSLLQKYMRDNLRLLQKRRIHYLSRSDMNDLVGWGGALRRDPAPLERRIRQVLMIPWFRVLVISHENTLGRPLRRGGAHLYPDAPEIIEQLGRVLRPYRARVFLSIRPQEQFLESYYLQTIHEGRHASFDEWLEQVDLDAVSWRPVCERLVETFGHDGVDVIDFRTIRQGQAAYVSDFFTRIDPRYTFDVEYDPMRNPSISDKGLRMALAANPYLKSGEERKLMRKFLQRHFSNVRYPRPTLFSDEQKAWLRDRYGAEYDALVGAPGGGSHERTKSAVGDR